MDYTALLKTRADETVAPLFGRVQKLEKQRAAVLDRLKNERENLALAEATLADFKGRAAEQLAKGTSAYQEFRGRLRRLKLEAEAARETLALLDAETRPAVERERADAREKLLRALTALYLAERPRCQARMAELISAVVEEHDRFFDAIRRLHQAHGLAFATPAFDHGVTVESARFAHFGKHTLTSPMHYVAFTDPPAPAEAPPVGQDDRQVAPESTISDPLDAEAKPKEDAAAVQSVPDPEKDAQDAPGTTNGGRLDTQDAPDADPEKSGTTPATFLTGDVAGTDPDAPPDAGKENPGIAADCA